MARAFERVELTTEFSLRLFALLRDSGIQLSTQQTLACTQAVVQGGVRDHEALYRICRVTLVNRRQDLPELERLFRFLIAVWYTPGPEEPDEQRSERLELEVSARVALGEGAADDAHESTETAGYSLREVDAHEDFRRMPSQDFPAALAALARIARRHAVVPRRKYGPARRPGMVDFRASLRDSRKHGGELLRLRWRDRVPTHTRLVVLVDVSGSMEVYGIFLLNFLHALRRSRWLKLEVFAFGTDLQWLTPWFRARQFEAVREQLSGRIAGWAGGTRIGHSLRCLNETYAGMVSAKTVVTIMSDGWDTGDMALLDSEMARLSRRARAVVWMNPLKGDPRYQPLAQGMATAWPYCDAFIAGHSIDSFEQFARIVTP